jgi:hypothetical protein
MSKDSIASACALVVCCYALARPAVAEFTGNTGPTVRSADVATRELDAGVTDRMQAQGKVPPVLAGYSGVSRSLTQRKRT